MSIIFLGTNTAFSLYIVQALLHSKHEVAGVVVPSHTLHIPSATDSPGSLPMLPSPTNDTTVGAALRHNVTVWSFETVPDELSAEVIIVACFPSRVPEALLRRASHAALNVHPSWLPAYRGPVPLFWQMRDGIRNPGVTIHHLTSEIDSGDIVSQRRVAIPEGTLGPEIDRLQSIAGNELLLDILDTANFSAHPQFGEVSYNSWPVDKDWHVPTDWPVRRAFNFMRGTAEWKHPFTLLTNPKPLAVRGATDYTLGAAQQGSSQRIEQGWRVGFADGWLRVR